MSLNYYGINKILGGRMALLHSPARFGNFNLLKTTADLLGQRESAFRRAAKPLRFTAKEDAKVAKAFEAVRDGRAPERVLWDESLSSRFAQRAKQLGLDAPLADLNRRLINIRKHPNEYKARGIELTPTSVIDPQPSIVPQYAHVIEFALVKMKNRYGASIDDILLNPVLVAEYEKLARKVARTLSSTELRLGALYIRKTRHVAKPEENLFDQLDADHFEAALQPLGTLDVAKAADIPKGEGLIEVLDRQRHLYVSRNENIRLVAEQFVDGQTLAAMANHFWTPDPKQITMRFFSGTKFDNVAIARWQTKIIQARDPIFNWPVRGAA